MPKRKLSESGRSDGDKGKVATVLHLKYGNMLLVWKKLRRIMLTPRGSGGETGDKEDIQKSWNTWDICLTPTCSNTYTKSRLDNLQSSFCTATPELFYSADVSYSVFNKKNLCVEERATVEQSRTEMIAYQREVCSWGICVLLRLCVLSLLNLYCVCQASEQRGAGHISGIQQLDGTLLILSSIPIFLYTGPISHHFNSYFLFFIFEK